jgi:hypothetical protein
MQTAVVGLVTKIKEVTEDSAIAIAAKGLNVPDDIQTVEDAKALWAYVTETFLPACKEVADDLAKPAPAPAPAPAASSEPLATVAA